MMVESLGQRLRRLRTEAGYTLRKFALEVGISAAYQSDIEYDRRVPTDDVLGRAVAVLGTRVSVSLDELVQMRPRVAGDVRQMIERTPAFNQLLRQVKETGKPPDEVIRELQEYLRKSEEGSESS